MRGKSLTEEALDWTPPPFGETLNTPQLALLSAALVFRPFLVWVQGAACARQLCIGCFDFYVLDDTSAARVCLARSPCCSVSGLGGGLRAF